MQYRDNADENTPSMGLDDVADYSNDIYETTAGDSISHSTNLRRRRKGIAAMGLMGVGIVFCLGGVVTALFAMRDNTPKSSTRPGPTPTPPPTDPPVVTTPTEPNMQPTPTERPTEGPTETPDAPTSDTDPTDSLFSFLSTLVPSSTLQDATTLAYAAYSWLQGNANLEVYSNETIKQRFAVASIYFGTNSESTWKKKDGWLSDEDECTWHGVDCQGHAVESLNLTENGLEGLIPWEITLLSDTLLSLDISRNYVKNSGQELAWMGELTQLRVLQVEETSLQFHGIPTYIKKLTDLKVLDFADTYFIGPLDGSIFEPLQNLVYLDIGGNMYNSTLPQEIAELPDLEAFYAYDCGLRGNIDFVTSLSSVNELWLDDNIELHGTIPTEIGHIKSLASLSLSGCSLSGQIPSEIGKLTKMEQMWLFGNWFSGEIPTEIGLLADLQILGLEDNNITEVGMPDEICDLHLLALSADCGGEYNFISCDCCDCCEFPCPIATLPDENRVLQSLSYN